MELPSDYNAKPVSNYRICLPLNNSFFRVYSGEMLGRPNFKHKWDDVDFTSTGTVIKMAKSDNHAIQKALKNHFGALVIFPHVSHIMYFHGSSPTNLDRLSLENPTLNVRKVANEDGSHEAGCEFDYWVGAHEIHERNKAKTFIDYAKSPFLEPRKGLNLDPVVSLKSENPGLDILDKDLEILLSNSGAELTKIHSNVSLVNF